MQATNHPKGNFLREQLSWVKLSGDIYLRSNRLMDNYPGSNSSEGGEKSGGLISSGAVILLSNCPSSGRNHPWGNYPGDNFPQGNLSGKQ